MHCQTTSKWGKKRGDIDKSDNWEQNTPSLLCRSVIHWHTQTYTDIHWHTLTYVHWHTLTYNWRTTDLAYYCHDISLVGFLEHQFCRHIRYLRSLCEFKNEICFWDEMPLLSRGIFNGTNDNNSRISEESRHGVVKAITLLCCTIPSVSTRRCLAAVEVKNMTTKIMNIFLNILLNFWLW